MRVQDLSAAETFIPVSGGVGPLQDFRERFGTLIVSEARCRQVAGGRYELELGVDSRKVADTRAQIELVIGDRGLLELMEAIQTILARYPEGLNRPSQGLKARRGPSGELAHAVASLGPITIQRTGVRDWTPYSMDVPTMLAISTRGEAANAHGSAELSLWIPAKVAASLYESFARR